MKKLTNKGFTLVELMVVIVIVGILAAVAIPKFTVASHKAKASEYPTVLSSIYQAEHTLQAETGAFKSATSTQLEDTLGVNVPTSNWFNYMAEAASASEFEALAGVKTAFGDATTSDTARIDEEGVKTASGALATYQPNWTN